MLKIKYTVLCDTFLIWFQKTKLILYISGFCVPKAQVSIPHDLIGYHEV